MKIFLIFFKNRRQLLVVESELGVEDGEHALVEGGEEVIHGFLQVQFAARVVLLQVAEQVGEHFAVLLVQNAVRPFEHVVKVAFRVLQQLLEEICSIKQEIFF